MQNDIDPFTSSLSATPELPTEVYTGVMHTIRRRRFVAHGLRAAALTAVIAASALLLRTSPQPASPVELAELNADLQSMQAFVNGSNLQEEYAQYTLVNEEWSTGETE